MPEYEYKESPDSVGNSQFASAVQSCRSVRKFSPDDEAAIEAAVEIALLLSNSNKRNAEILVKTVLTDNFNLLSSTAATIRSETLAGNVK